MLRSIIYLLKLSAFWLLFFTIYRVCFFLCYIKHIPEDKTTEAILIFWNALRLDISAISYLILIPYVLWVMQQFMKANLLNRINHFYNLALITTLSILCISNIAIYGDMKSLINYNTIYFMVDPAKNFPYMTTLELIGVCIGAAIIISIFVLIFRVLILMVIPHSTNKLILKLLIAPIFIPILFTTLRGGTQKTPINESFVSTSSEEFFNTVCVNPVWHLGQTTLAAWNKPEN